MRIQQPAEYQYNTDKGEDAATRDLHTVRSADGHDFRQKAESVELFKLFS